MSKNNTVIENTIVTMAQLSEDEKIREQLLREEKAEFDKRSARDNGFAEGHTIGLNKGISVLSQLIQLLIQNDRQNEIDRVTSDPEYCDKLMKEFKLI